MKIKKWLVGTGMAVLLSGLIVSGLPMDAMAVGGSQGTGKGVNGQFTRGAGMGMQQGICTGIGMQGARRGGGVGMGGAINGMSTNVADFLGISLTDLRTARQSGKSMAQIAVDAGKTEQELIDFMSAQRIAQLDQLVVDGKITQAQADLCKQTMGDRIKSNVERTSVGRNAK